MNKRHEAKYAQLFDYLSADEPAHKETGLIVFGRKDLLVARKAIDIIRRDGTPWMIITGGIGKDSGNLQIPEAEYLANEVYRERTDTGLVVPETHLDTKSTNGGENTRNSLAIMQSEQLPFEPGITTVAHATSSRRLAEMMKHTAHNQDTPLAVYRRASDYEFDSSNPADQDEARAEMLRLMNWPEKGWLLPQTDLPENLVDFVQDVDSSQRN